jgi:hypothetical protein
MAKMPANRNIWSRNDKSEHFMRKETNSKTTAAIGKEQMVDTSKLMSLLALAAGAVAMPETGNASIVYTNLATPGTVAHGSNPGFLITLPGTARLGFQTAHAVTTLGTVRGVLAGQVGVTNYVRLKTNLSFAVHVPASNMATWNQLAYNTNKQGTLGRATDTHYTPNSYAHDYLPFEFKDSTQGNKMLYGWVDVSLTNQGLLDNPVGVGPQLTIWRYAYDDTGTPIIMGQTAVPEPASMSLMALGAMALGARGVRAWRKKRGAQ